MKWRAVTVVNQADAFWKYLKYIEDTFMNTSKIRNYYFQFLYYFISEGEFSNTLSGVLTWVDLKRWWLTVCKSWTRDARGTLTITPKHIFSDLKHVGGSVSTCKHKTVIFFVCLFGKLTCTIRNPWTGLKRRVSHYSTTVNWSNKLS